jgi:tRNA dimethylallyltransferase
LERALNVVSSADPADSRTLPLLVVVLGPTGSGKTALSVALAEQFGGEVVNCDSVALYRDFEIGTAKPSASDRARVPHHLLDVYVPDEDVTAGDYARRARLVLQEIAARQRLPVVVGGTGLYLRALIEGLFAGPQRCEDLRNRLRSRAQAKGSTYLHKVLHRLDASAAQNIHANDTPKLIRAIEVCLTSKKEMSTMWEEGRNRLEGFRVLRIGLNPERKDLYAHLNQRAQQMFASGLVEETRALRAKYGDAARPLSAMGYKQALQFLRGEVDLNTAITSAAQAHRNYAKRQMTWFRREPDVHWLPGFGNDVEIQKRALSILKSQSAQP